jgi:DNA-binding transcriptional LysR family regulator
MLEADEAARATLSDNTGMARGILRVTAPTVFGQAVIMPLIPSLLAENPALQIDLTLSDSIVDIVGLGIDVAIRIATLRDSALVARTLAPNPRVICASPGYLARHGTLATLENLKDHPCIGLHGMPFWPFVRQGENVAIRAEASFSANSVEAVRTASKLGLGLAMLTYWDIRNELEDGSLVLVELEDVVPEQLSIAAVLPTRQQVPTRVRVFLERLEVALKDVREGEHRARSDDRIK